jgi:hypothetical protein
VLSGGLPAVLHQIFRLYLSVDSGGLGGLAAGAGWSLFLKDSTKSGPTTKGSRAGTENQIVSMKESGNEEYIVLKAIEISVAFNHVGKRGGFDFFYHVTVENVLVPESVAITKFGELVYQDCLESLAE